MKNTKISTIILAVITVLSLLVDILVANAELIGIDAKIVSLIAMVVTMIKAVYDNRHLFSETELVSFGNFVMKQDVYKSENVKGQVTHADLANWELKKEL